LASCSGSRRPVVRRAVAVAPSSVFGVPVGSIGSRCVSSVAVVRCTTPEHEDEGADLLVRVHDELASHLDGWHAVVVVPSDGARCPVVGDVRQPVAEVDRVLHRASALSAFPRGTVGRPRRRIPPPLRVEGSLGSALTGIHQVRPGTECEG